LNSFYLFKKKQDASLFKFSNHRGVSVLKDATDDEEEDSNDTIIKDFDDIEKELENLKVSKVTLKLPVKVTNKKSEMQTVEIERKKKELEDRLKSEQAKKEKKQRDLEELEKMSTTLRNDEAERKKLDDEYKRKLLLAAETKEASKTELKRAEARLIELKIKQTKIANIFAELKKAEQVDICFMLDSTGSMSSYISEAKNVIHRIIDKLKNRFQDFQLRASFVGYRDHADGLERVTVYDFDQNFDSFKMFVTSVEATGGQDQCEDVFGGLEVFKFNIV
jgi:DNA repair exonuclease SbcCD ATPase subunit